jgi:hypothetical protein
LTKLERRLQKNNGRQPQKINKNGRQPQKKWKLKTTFFFEKQECRPQKNGK